MHYKEITINKKEGLLNKDAAFLVQSAMKFESDIFLEQEFKKINAKSIMGVISMGLRKGDKVVVTAKGSDAAEAIIELSKILEGK